MHTRSEFFGLLTAVVAGLTCPAGPAAGGSPLLSPDSNPAAVMASAENSPPKIISGWIVFTKQIIGVNVDETHFAAAADLDGDGDVDVVATDYIDDTVFWYENDGSGGFLTHTLDASLDGAYPAGVADVDGDGDSDVLAAGYLGDTVVWYENDGVGGFTRRIVDAAANGAHSVVTGDMDLDGDLDLLATNQDGGTVTWYENDGSQTFALHLIDGTASGAKRAEFADVDDDGDPDVVSAAFNVDEIAWHRNDGNQNFTKLTIDNTADGAYFVTPADIDGDGDTDVLAASQWDNTVALYLNNGLGQFTAMYIDTDVRGARAVIAADVDRDGDLDAVAASVDDDTVGWYENRGGAVFIKRAVDDGADGAYGVFAIDMNRDGDIDVLSASRDADAVAVHHQSKAHRALLAEHGGTLVIDAALLLTVDSDDGPAELTYTLTNGPDSGELRVDGVMVPGGGTFTQDDIDNFRLTYVHDGSMSFADRFYFTVADGGEGGLSPAAGSFTISLLPTGGLLAHWPLDEVSGLVAEDVAGEYDGTLVGGPAWQPDGRFGGALTFDGTDDLVDVGTLDVGAGTGMTLALWLRPSALTNDERLISKATDTAEQAHYWMVSTIYGTALRFRLKAGGVTSTLFTGQYELEIGEWYHVACTYDQTQMRIYGNGVLLASLAKTGLIDTNPAVAAAIGNQPPGAGSRPFAGDIDDVRVYERALNEAEIAALAENGNPPTGVGSTRRPADYLGTNYPNPFNPVTAIRYGIGSRTHVSLKVFNVAGRLVRTLVDEVQTPRAGGFESNWDGRDEAGRPVTSGVYFYRLATARFAETRKMVLVK